MFENKLIKTKLWLTRPGKEGSIFLEDGAFSNDCSIISLGTYVTIAMHDPNGVAFEDLLEFSFLRKTMPNQSKDMKRFKKRFIEILKELLDEELIILENHK